MSTNVTLNGVTYAIPAEGDSGWGTVLSNYFIAISTSVLQKTGGTFTLTAEADFGATYGLKSAYLKSQASNPSGVGVVRLGNTEAVSWRNAANSANLSLAVDASNNLQFNGSNVLYAGGGLIVNADVSASAAIAVSKLEALTASKAVITNGSGIMMASLASSLELSYLSGVSSAIQTQIDTKAPAASPTFSGTITTPLTASRALVTGASSQLAASATTATELGYVSGVTSSIQTQLDAKVAKATLTTKGDIYVATGAGVVVRKAAGSDGTVLSADSGQSDGLNWIAPLTNPMTTGGDIIYGGASGVATRLANGSALQMLASAGGTSPPVWTPQGILAVRTLTAGSTLADSDDVVLCDVVTTGSFNLALHDPATARKKLYRIILTSATGANKLSLTAYNLKGALRKLCTQYESVTIYPDGSGWQVIEHYTDSNQITWNATTSWTGNVTNTGWYYRQAGFMYGFQKVVCSNAPTPSANLTITTPFTMDTNQINDTTGGLQKLGDVQVLDAGTQYYASICSYNTSTTILCNTFNASATFVSSVGSVSLTTPITFGASDEVLIQFKAPIVDWW